MSDDRKTKDQLRKELALANQLIAELHNSASEHKLIGEAIKGSEERYRNLVENAHDVLWVFDLNLGYTYVSPSVKHFRGYRVEEAMKQRLDQVLTSQSYKKALEMFKRERDLEMGGQRHGPDWSLTTELEMIRKDGTTVWAEVTLNTLYNEKGRIKGIMGITRDISDRKKAEEALLKSEDTYRSLTEKMNDIIWTADLDLHITFDSPSAERVFGFAIDERMKQQASEMMTPESYARALKVLSAELERDHDEGVDPDRSIKLELEYYHKNGSTVWMECVMSAIRNNAGDIIGIHGVSRDITDRKRAEAALRESEDRFRSLIQKSSDIIIILDNNGFITYETPSLESILGYEPGRLIGKTPFVFIHPDDFKRVETDLNEVYQKTNPGTPTEFRFCKADGTWAYLEAIGQNLLEDPAINGLVITARDITERKRAEEIRRKAEAKYCRLYESMMDAFVNTDMAGYIKEYNETYLSMIGYTAEEIKALTYKDITPDKWHTFEDRIIKKQILQRGYSDIYEKEYRRKDGTIFPVELRTILIRDDAGEPIGMWAIVRDITERKLIENELKKHRDHLEDVVKERTVKLIQANERLKQEIDERKRAEDALRMNEEIYRIHFSLSNDVMFTNDEDFRVLSVTPNVERVLGYKPEELVGRTFQEMDVLHPDDMGKAFDNAKNVLYGGVSRHPTYRFITKDGKTKFGEVSGVPLIKKGHGTTLISVARDVTERIEKEQLLLETLDRYNTHFALTNDVMFTFDHKLRFNSISPNVEKVTGYKPEELIGKPAHKLGVFPSEYQDEAYDEAMHLLSGQTINSSIYEFITKDGKRKFGEFSSSPLKRDGQVVEVISVAREITGRIEMQELLQKSEETLQTLLNASSDSMILLDTSGTMFALNNVAAKRLGKSIKELIGTCLFDHMPKDISNRRKAFFEQAVSSGKTTRFIDEREGRLYSISFHPIHNTHGKVVQVASYAHDVTRLKHDFLKHPAKPRGQLT